MKEFLDIFWRAFLIIIGLFVLLVALPYFIICKFGDVAGIIAIVLAVCVAIAGLIAGVVVTFE